MLAASAEQVWQLRRALTGTRSEFRLRGWMQVDAGKAEQNFRSLRGCPGTIMKSGSII